MITVEQILAAQKSNVDTLTDLAGKAFEGIESLIELNLSAAKSALTEAAQTTQAALSVKEPQELVALQHSLLQTAGENVAAYNRTAYEIAASTGAAVSGTVEAQFAEAQAKFMAIVESAVKNAPAGSENVVALIKTQIAAANNAIETAKKAAKQAVEVAEANVQAVAKSAGQTATKAKRGA